MKLFAKIMAVLTVLAMLSVVAFADDFVSSPEKADGVELIEGDVVISAADDFEGIDEGGFEDLVDGFADKWHAATNAPVDNAEVTKSFVVNTNGVSQTVTIKVDNLGDKIVLLAKNNVTGEWTFVEFTRDGNNLTFTLNGDYTIVILEDNGNAPVVDKPVQSPQTGVQSVSVLLAVSTVVLLAAAVVLSKKARNVA